MLIWIILSSAFIAVFLLVRALFSKKITASAMYVLWILVAVRLLIPTYIPVEFNLFPAQNVPSITSQIEAVEDNISGYFAGADISTQDAINLTVPVTPADTVVQDVTPNSGATVQDNNDNNLANVATDINPIITNITSHPFQFIWILGILGFGCYFIITNICLSLRLKRSRILLESYECKIPVYLVKWLPAPCMTGLIHPAIYVNEQLYEVENPNYVLQHEYMHYRHKDMIWMLIQTILLCIHWFNPLVWIASYLFRKDCEYACDEALAKSLNVEERIAYGRTLLFFETTKGHKYSVFSTATSMSMDGKTMKKRVHAIVDTLPKRILSVVVVCVLVVVLFTGSFISSSKEPIASTTEDKYWNETYVVENSTIYYSFYPNGTLEHILKGNYALKEKNGQKLLILSYDTISTSNDVKSPSSYDIIFLISKLDNSNTQILSTDQYFTEDIMLSKRSHYYELTEELKCVDGVSGLTSDIRNFEGEYYKVDKDLSNPVTYGYRFYLDGTFEEFQIHEYEILNNHEIEMDDFTYQYLLKEDNTALSIWVKDREDVNTLHLDKIGTTQAVDLQIMNAYVSFVETDGVKMDYSYEENGETVGMIDIVTPLYMGYEFTIESTGFRGIEDLVFDIVPSDSLESFLADKMFSGSDRSKQDFYKNFDSVYDFYGSTLEGVTTDLKSDGMAAFDKRYQIGYTDESVEENNEILKNAAFSKDEREKLSKLMTEVTFVVYTDNTELALIQFSEDGKPIISADSLIRIEQSDLTKEVYSNQELLNAASHIVSEFQTTEGFENCTLLEVRFAEDNTYEYLSQGKKNIVFEVEFQAGMFSSPGLRAGNTYTYFWNLYPSNESLNDWITKSFG